MHEDEFEQFDIPFPDSTLNVALNKRKEAIKYVFDETCKLAPTTGLRLKLGTEIWTYVNDAELRFEIPQPFYMRLDLINDRICFIGQNGKKFRRLFLDVADKQKSKLLFLFFPIIVLIHFRP